MSVDHMFSGYRAAEVANNKARMEAARQEFSVEDHLRQLEEQEKRHASGAMAEEERSDDEQPSELDPAVSLFRVRVCVSGSVACGCGCVSVTVSCSGFCAASIRVSGRTSRLRCHPRT